MCSFLDTSGELDFSSVVESGNKDNMENRGVWRVENFTIDLAYFYWS
jgi:hypothetical protein